jgi:tetratricopeptide (TPR) repeat protein
MTTRLPGLAAAAALLFSTASLASADIVITRDGKVLPDKVADAVVANEYPSDEALQRSGAGNLELRYDRVKVGKDSVSAGFVRDVYGTNALRQANFSNALNQATAQFWVQAARSFNTAAEELKDADRQIALWLRLTCLRNAGDLDGTETAANEFIAAFPEGYYAPQAQMVLARVALARGKTADAKAILQRVSALNGLNARDFFEAAVSEIDWFTFPAARNEAGYAAAEKAYRELVQKIKSKGAAAEAAIPLFKAQVGVGKSLVAQGKPKEAAPFFNDVVANPDSLSDKSLLAAAYRGLGDVVYLDVQARKQASGKDQAAALIEELDNAALHYMRVCHFYRDDAGDSLQPAWQSGAQVFEWQFDLAGKRDAAALVLLERSIAMYYQAHKLMGQGETKRQLTGHIKELIERRDELRKELSGDEPKKD